MVLGLYPALSGDNKICGNISILKIKWRYPDKRMLIEMVTLNLII